jgi:recombination protein RecA
VEEKIVDKSGAWFSYGETRLGQGKEKACDFINANKDIFDEINNKVRAILFEDEEEANKKEEENKEKSKKDAEEIKEKAA